MRGGGDEGPGVGPEQRQPMGDVAGVVGMRSRRQSEPCQDEGGAEFGDELLGRIGARAEAGGQLPVKTASVSRPVDQLVRQGGAVAIG